MTSFIFVVDPESLELCIKLGVCGCPQHSFPRSDARGLADLAATRPGSKVLFYVKGSKAIYGIYEAKGFPFYDETPIWSDNERVFPYRVLIDATLNTFSNPIFLSDLYDLADKDILWSWRGVVQRDVHPFTDSECSELLRLFHRNNPMGPKTSRIESPYKPKEMKPLPIELKSDSKGRIITPGAREANLTAWFMSQLAQRKFKEYFGEYTDYINYVPISYEKEIDVLLLNEIQDYRGIRIGPLASCTVVEIKADRCKKQDLTQTLRYEDWLIRKKCAGDSAMVHSSILAHSFDAEVIDYVKKRTEIERKELKLLRYLASQGKVDLSPISWINRKT